MDPTSNNAHLKVDATQSQRVARRRIDGRGEGTMHASCRRGEECRVDKHADAIREDPHRSRALELFPATRWRIESG